MFRKLGQKIDKLNEILEKASIRELSYILGNRKQIFFRNLMAGIGRGVGIGIGVTLVTAIIIILLRNIVKLNIPVIGNYIADIIEIVEQKQY